MEAALLLAVVVAAETSPVTRVSGDVVEVEADVDVDANVDSDDNSVSGSMFSPTTNTFNVSVKGGTKSDKPFRTKESCHAKFHNLSVSTYVSKHT